MMKLKSISVVLCLIPLLLGTATMSAHADLPPKIEADMLMVDIRKDVDTGHYADALPKFDRLASLNVQLPDTIDFHWGKALVNTPGNGFKQIWQQRQAMQHLESYLAHSDSTGQFYKEALELYASAEKKYKDAGGKKGWTFFSNCITSSPDHRRNRSGEIILDYKAVRDIRTGRSDALADSCVEEANWRKCTVQGSVFTMTMTSLGENGVTIDQFDKKNKIYISTEKNSIEEYSFKNTFNCSVIDDSN